MATAPHPEHDEALVAALDLSTPAGRRELAYLAALRWDGSAEIARPLALQIAETARLCLDLAGPTWTLWVTVDGWRHMDLWEREVREKLSVEEAARALRADFWGIP